MAINSALSGAMAGQVGASMGVPKPNAPQQVTQPSQNQSGFGGLLKQSFANTNKNLSLMNPVSTVVRGYAPLAPILGKIGSTALDYTMSRPVTGSPSNLIQNADKANGAFESFMQPKTQQNQNILPQRKPPVNSSFSYGSQNTAGNTGFLNQNTFTKDNSATGYISPTGYVGQNDGTENYGNNEQNTATNGASTQQDAYSMQLKALQDKINGLNDNYANYLKPSQQELDTQAQADAVQNQIRNLNASDALGLANIQAKPIALEFQQGQQAALQRQAAAQSQALSAQAEPLQIQLARLQALRQNQAEVNKYQTDSAQNQLNSFTSRYKPTEVSEGSSLVRLNPATGQYEKIVDGGQKKTDDIRNYEYAKNNGFQGTIQDYQKEKLGMSSGAYDIQTDPTTGQFYRINKLTGQTEPISGVGGVGQFQVGVKPSDSQNAAAGFSSRASASNSIIDKLGSVGSEMKGVVSGSGLFPNLLKSSDRQQLEQAQRDFVNSVLRRESGAAISPAEFQNAAQQYFPQPGDSNAVMQQKAANRMRTIQNLNRESGPALKQNPQVAMNNSNMTW